jgi:archaellum component FlaG (FlaF/FlaG flagellin family)
MNTKSIFSIAAVLLLTAGAAHARHTDLDGKIKVHNDRQRAVRLLIDGDFVTRVGPGETKLLRNVANGVRLLEVESRGRDQLHKVAVPIHGVVGFTVKARRGSAEVVNDSGIRMRITLDGQSMGTVEPGRRLMTRRMRPGTYELVAAPAGRGLPHTEVMRRRVQIRRGDAQPVRLGAWHATMRIHNPMQRKAKVFIDGRKVGKLRQGDVLTAAHQVPGRHTVELRRKGDVVARIVVDLSPGESERVRPATLRGSLRVVNRDRRPVDVLVDGERRGRAEAHGSRVINNLRPGQHRVTVIHRRGRTTEHMVQVRTDRTMDLALRGRSGRDRNDRHGRGEYVARR